MPDSPSQEQVDRIVEQVLVAGTSQGSKEQDAFEEWALDSGFDGDWDGGGTVVPENVIPALDAHQAHFLNDRISESRVSALQDGSPPAASEEKLFREAWLDAMCLEGEADADAIPGYAWHTLKHSDGRTCIAAILAKGYSFSGVEYRWLGFYPSVSDLYRALRAIGHLDADREKRATTSEAP